MVNYNDKLHNAFKAKIYYTDVYFENVYVEYISHEYFGDSKLLKSVKVFIIKDLDEYIKTGKSEKKEFTITQQKHLKSWYILLHN
ncbi:MULTISPECIES: hypothetical protein [unclassified Tenacibaculum]|uniref:hypothetical protein n=1 Tax=unclassified Tenacibaculum TaxID=2635139 RepID=UPI001F2FB3EC|nr:MULTISPECIES: hypothetical protein [unclassified Tenacibaculum]MCF2875388.1 hypothetical protein [Tenacibaculum sp. Cn5-1]MCF2935464.1 hypothetical protein [Tenacibaculum sp. Cn5-34]MCG7512024.1 hypothetical protein [Tenacibaculum sp. Cn5-46]